VARCGATRFRAGEADPAIAHEASHVLALLRSSRGGVQESRRCVSRAPDPSPRGAAHARRNSVHVGLLDSPAVALALVEGGTIRSTYRFRQGLEALGDSEWVENAQYDPLALPPSRRAAWAA
jgi:hypothetical protein